MKFKWLSNQNLHEMLLRVDGGAPTLSSNGMAGAANGLDGQLPQQTWHDILA